MCAYEGARSAQTDRRIAPEVPRGLERSGPGLWGGVQALADRSQVPRARRVLRRFDPASASQARATLDTEIARLTTLISTTA